MYSLVPKERHVRKESHDCLLSLCIGCKERHDSTSGQSIDPKATSLYDMSIQTGCFQFIKSSHDLGNDPKETHDNALLKRLFHVLLLIL